MSRQHIPQVDGRVAVAIPVHNEAALIGPCLLALADQTIAQPFDVVLLLNNCSDGTEDVVHRLAPQLPFRLQIHEYWLEPNLLNAGIARRMAVQHATSFVGEQGVLLTTDADSAVPPNWIAANVGYIDSGCDAVAGCTRMNAADEALLPPHLAEDEAAVMAYASMLDEIDYRLNPTPHDPWPRHTEHSGASIAVRAARHSQVGGIPGVPSGEDREFFERLRQVDAKVRHAPEIVVTVSGRLVGRAAGGMAETISRRMQLPDIWLDDDLETTSHRVARARLRAAVARARDQGAARDEVARLARELRVSPLVVERAIMAASLGAGWSDLERLSPTLTRVRLPRTQLVVETEKAFQVLCQLRRDNALSSGPTYPGDTASRASGGPGSRLAASPE